uniref:Major facilitator superfamily (MFS) profile domain-containing protein n=1 Tax=Petromyzon marinus TaxID=7757 RepID=S4R5I0_PETMA
MAPPTSSGTGEGVPDGGWGWLVLAGSVISIGFSYATPKGVTVYYKEIQEVFDTTYSEIAWISSIMLAFMYGWAPLGPVCGVLVNKFGSRPVVILGGIMAGVGMIIASFATSIMQLYICLGVLVGMGLAFNLQPSLTMIGVYFYKRRPIAYAVGMMGSPLLLSTLAPLNQFLLNTFGWRGSFLILGGILLNCCVAGALFRPLQLPVKKPTVEEKKAEEEVPLATIEGKKAEEVEEVKKKSACGKITDLLDLTLFVHRGFMIYLVGNVLMYIGLLVPIVFLTPSAKHMGIEEYSAALLLTVLAMVDLVARPAWGAIANSRWLRPQIHNMLSLSILLTGVCDLLCPLATGFWGLAVFAVGFAVFYGLLCAVLFEALMDLVGAKRFPSALGLVTMAVCCPLLVGPPFGGWLVDRTGSYNAMYLTCGGIMVLSGLFLGVGNFIHFRLLRREQLQEQSQDQKGDLELSGTRAGSGTLHGESDLTHRNGKKETDA